MKKSILCLLILMFCLSSCGQKESEKKVEPSVSPVPLAQLSAESTATPTPTQIPGTAHKTVEEALQGLIYETPEEVQSKYFTAEFNDVRHDDITEWKDAKGNYHAPKGYKIACLSSAWFTEQMASQQMPQELLDEISTEELYQLIMNLPVETWSVSTTNSYLQMTAKYYVYYNFMTDFIQREDSAEVVHRYYQKYSKKEKLKYTGNTFMENRGKGLKDTQEDLQKQERFQVTEGLEWFFRYKEGKSIPEEEELMLGVGAYGHY